MHANDAPVAEESRRTGSVPRYVALALFVTALVAGALAVHFAADAADARDDLELLKDGVDRSSLPADQAVALAQLARSRSAPVPVSEQGSHHHMPTYGEAQRTPGEQARFDEQWAEATGAVERFDTLEEALALGYVQSSGHTDGTGLHYTKWSIVDRPFDPAQPSQLLFEQLERGQPPELIAYSYWVASDGEPEGFAGDEDAWHRHLGVCFVDGMIKDENMERGECVGDWLNGVDLWMVHAWVVPGVENRYGRFHNVNPLLCEHACGLEN